MPAGDLRPFVTWRELPLPEVGDFGSFEREPLDGERAPHLQVELDRLDLEAEPPTSLAEALESLRDPPAEDDA